MGGADWGGGWVVEVLKCRRRREMSRLNYADAVTTSFSAQSSNDF